MFLGFKRQISRAFAIAALAVAPFATPVAAQSVDDFIDGTTFVFNSTGGVADLIGGVAPGERTNVVCIADDASSLDELAPETDSIEDSLDMRPVLLLLLADLLGA